MSSSALETRGLTKHYGAVRALVDLSLRVEDGEVFGFLGPNGAGKTTTIRLLLGLLRPTAGTFTIAPRSEIGYLPGELALWTERTGAETLDLLARLSGCPPVRRDALLRALDLEPGALRRPVHTYSDGMKQKLGIVQALQGAPRLALLDEPTKGLDPLVQQTFYAILEEERARGATVFFSSHVLPEVERVCDRVAMVRAGRLVALGGVEEMRRSQRRRVVVTFTADVVAQTLEPFGEIVRSGAREVELLVTQERLAALVTRVGQLPLADLVVEPPRLEDAFLEQYR